MIDFPGLTINQLRWIFSSFTIHELISNGWDPTALPFSDGDDSTHLWSELNENCTATEIAIVDLAGQDTMRYFNHKITTGPGEELREHNEMMTNQEVDDFLHSHGGKILLHPNKPFFPTISPLNHSLSSIQHSNRRYHVQSFV
jgi:hypothetical protein